MLGLLVASSPAGWAVALMTTAGFLLRHPAKMFLRNRHRLAASPRYRAAGLVALAYAGLAGAGAATAMALEGVIPLTPFVILAPVLVAYAAYDLTNQARRILPELAGPAGLAAAAPAIALASDWRPAAAAALWVILVARIVPSVVYVRSRLRLERHEPIDRWHVWLCHGLSIGAVAALYGRRLAPLTTILALVGLGARAAGGLSAGRRKGVRARYVGFTELGFGLVYILLTAAGFRLGW